MYICGYGKNYCIDSLVHHTHQRNIIVDKDSNPQHMEPIKVVVLRNGVFVIRPITKGLMLYIHYHESFSRTQN